MVDADDPEEQARAWRERFDRALAGESFVAERAQAHPDRIHHWEDHFSPVRESDGVVSGVVVTSHDVTAHKRAEDEVRQLNAELEERIATRTAQLEVTNKELEAFAYSVSHDLRAPLRAIDGFSAVLAEDAGARLTSLELMHLDRIRRAAQRMGELIDDLLGLSRAASQELARTDVDVSRMAEGILAELGEAQPHRRVETTVAPLMRAEADLTLLRVILVNLLENAWKFTSKHAEARIEVGVQEAGGERAFFVRDDGAGFDPAYARNLFGAFQRMHAATDFEGTGIGLATVQRLVARHGGRVWAEAEVEKGATFYFTLPGPAA
jgi:light-regulated signal transduction histidine kinase (bacteriophytochrome)